MGWVEHSALSVDILVGIFVLKFLLNLLMAFLVSVCFWTFPVVPVQAANQSQPLLTLEDLPQGFVPASESETSSCRMAGEVSAFVVRETEQTELVCISSFSLTVGAENPEQAEMVRQVFDAILQSPQTFVAQANAVDVEGIEVLQNLADVGEVAAGFSKTEAEIGRTEVALFRRGDFLNTVLIRYQPEHAPLESLPVLAHKLDQRVSAISAEH